jgi:hypothetical protein
MALFNPRSLHLTVSARIDRMMNVYFFVVGFANATRQQPAKSVNQVDGQRVTECHFSATR